MGSRYKLMRKWLLILIIALVIEWEGTNSDKKKQYGNHG